MMRMTTLHTTRAGRAAKGLGALLLPVALLSGCFAGNDDGPMAADKADAETAATAATRSLESAVAEMSDYKQFEYGKEDLTSLRNANAEFRKAEILDPGNRKARLGSAITGVLLAVQSKRLSDLINQALDAKSPFDPALVEGAPLARLSVMQRAATASEWPEFHLIQDAIADTLLPALDAGIADLRSVYGDPAFSMTLTVDGRVIELDHAEAGVLLGGFIALKSLVTLFLAYDVDLDIDGSYGYIEELAGIGDIDDFSQLTQAQKDAFNQLTVLLKPGSPFMAVRPAWAARLAEVDDGIKEALGILKESVGSVRGETDDQEDDVLKVCGPRVESDCIKSADFDDGLAAIDTGLKYLSQPYQLEIPDLDTTLSVNLAAYLSVQDYKKMLPYYGFYDANEWSEEKPVFYFSNPSGGVTGNIKTLEALEEQAQAEDWPARRVVEELKKIIHFQDPTFQGLLPGATSEGIWSLITKAAEKEDGDVVVAKRAAYMMGPRFGLSLLGKR